MTDPREPPVPSEPVASPYRLVCIIALAALAAAMMEKRMGMWSFVPALVGGLALLGGWRSGPVAVLLVLCVAMAGHVRGIDPLQLVGYLLYGSAAGGFGRLPGQRLDPLPDLAASAAVVAYIAANYRLQASEHFVFPVDLRQRVESLFTFWRAKQEEAPRTRPARLVTPLEIGLLAAALPIWVGLAAIALYWLLLYAPGLSLIDEAWRAPALLLWMLALALAVLTSLRGYLRQCGASREEATLFLQEQLWHDTRREQGRIGRWEAWARLRGQRRKEKP